jgi:outer membrane protein OmpA-like peptidoglycan-associated protein
MNIPSLAPRTARSRACILIATLLALVACQSPPPAPAQARVATLQKLGFVAAPEGWQLDLGVKLLFDSDSADLSDAGRSGLAKLARELHAAGITHLRVDGHTDNQGSTRHNAGLSLRRAEAVVKLLQQTGWRDLTVDHQGLGAERPVADNATTGGRAQNRRVVITVTID